MLPDGTGLDDKGLPVVPATEVTGAMWLAAARTLTRIAELGEQAGRVSTPENLNTAVDHPGVPFARAADTLAIVEAVDSPYLRMNLDPYHAQIGERNLIELIRRAGFAIGEIQVADVPGLMEPGTREINYPGDRARSTASATSVSWASRGGPPPTLQERSAASALPSASLVADGLSIRTRALPPLPDARTSGVASSACRYPFESLRHLPGCAWHSRRAPTAAAPTQLAPAPLRRRRAPPGRRPR